MQKIRSVGIAVTLLLVVPLVCFAETVVLKSGKTLQGKIVEKTDKYVKIEVAGVAITYFMDEIKSIDGKEPIVSASKNNNLTDATSYFKSGVMHASQEKFKEAEKEFRTALKLNNFDSDCEEALRIINDFNNKLISEEYAGVFFKGAYYLVQGEHQKAIQEFEKAIQINPNYDAAYQNLGVTQLSSGRSEEAIINLQKAIQLNPNNAVNYFSLASLYQSLGKLQEALRNYQKSLEIDSDYVQACCGIGTSYMMLNNFKEALASFEKCLQINPGEADIYLGRGMVYDLLGQPQDAKENFQKAKELYEAKGDNKMSKETEEMMNRFP